MGFRLLGPFEADHGGRPVTAGRRRECCLLGVLLLEANTAVPTDRLLDLLWDDDPPDTARTVLQTHICRLRANVDPGGDGALGIKILRLGDLYRRLGRMSEAFETLERGRAVARELGDPIECYLLTTLEQANLTVGDHAQAAQYCRDALNLLSSTADRRMIVVLRCDLGTSLWAGGERDAARASWRAALAIAQEFGMPTPVAARIRALLDTDDPVIEPVSFEG